jgi:hypothetical protein
MHGTVVDIGISFSSLIFILLQVFLAKPVGRVNQMSIIRFDH